MYQEIAVEDARFIAEFLTNYVQKKGRVIIPEDEANDLRGRLEFILEVSQ